MIELFKYLYAVGDQPNHLPQIWKIYPRNGKAKKCAQLSLCPATSHPFLLNNGYQSFICDNQKYKNGNIFG